MLVSGLSPKQFDIIKTEIDFDTTAMQKYVWKVSPGSSWLNRHISRRRGRYLYSHFAGGKYFYDKNIQ